MEEKLLEIQLEIDSLTDELKLLIDLALDNKKLTKFQFYYMCLIYFIFISAFGLFW